MVFCSYRTSASFVRANAANTHKIRSFILKQIHTTTKTLGLVVTQPPTFISWLVRAVTVTWVQIRTSLRHFRWLCGRYWREVPIHWKAHLLWINLFCLITALIFHKMYEHCVHGCTTQFIQCNYLIKCNNTNLMSINYVLQPGLHLLLRRIILNPVTTNVLEGKPP